MHRRSNAVGTFTTGCWGRLLDGRPARRRAGMPALPYCKARIAANWKPSGYPKTLNQIGDHLRARRLDLGLHQRHVALRLGVHAASVRNWEMGRTEPALDMLRGVIAFLGYDPRPEPSAIGEMIKLWRTARGLS
jgi:DNA-binding XRE family transcriptional regulator